MCPGGTDGTEKSARTALTIMMRMNQCETRPWPNLGGPGPKQGICSRFYSADSDAWEGVCMGHGPFFFLSFFLSSHGRRDPIGGKEASAVFFAVTIRASPLQRIYIARLNSVESGSSCTLSPTRAHACLGPRWLDPSRRTGQALPRRKITPGQAACKTRACWNSTGIGASTARCQGVVMG